MIESDYSSIFLGAVTSGLAPVEAMIESAYRHITRATLAPAHSSVLHSLLDVECSMLDVPSVLHSLLDVE